MELLSVTRRWRKAEDMTAAREVDLRALAEGPASEC
jgi:hypothetical protein